MSLRESLPYVIIALLLVYIFSIKREVITVEIPSKNNSKLILKPKPVVRLDSTLLPSMEYRVVQIPNPINQELLSKYNQAKESLTKLQVFKEAVTQREYIETLKDSTQTITVRSKVTGTLDEQIISYRTNPITIERKSLKSSTELYLGAFSTISSDLKQNLNVGVQANLKTKSKIYTIGYDVQKNIHLGISFKIL